MAAPSALVSAVPLYPAEKAASAAKVCVTGATGFIAGPVIERLLRAGHTVHATCRDPKNTKNLSRMMALPGANERLRFFAADLSNPGSFDEAIAGCDYVVHMAAPVVLNGLAKGEGRKRVVEPMVQGVENVLGAVTKAGTVKRVVMTSSISACCNGSSYDKPTGVIGEEDWNTQATEDFYPYGCGKAKAEQRAWALARAPGTTWDLVTLCPAMVFGPTVELCASSESVEFMQDLRAGLQFPFAGEVGFGFVDVRDVAAAHCLAMVTPHAKGRYILSAISATCLQMTRTCAAVFPGFRAGLCQVPWWLVYCIAPLLGVNRDVVHATRGPPPMFNSSRVCAELGMSYNGMDVMLRDMLIDMADKGLIKATKKGTSSSAATATATAAASPAPTRA